MSEGDHDEAADRKAQKCVRGLGIGLVACALTVVVVLLVIARGRSGQTMDDPTYWWSLQFPGTPPGASFKTKPGDDLALALRIVLPEDESPWQTMLAARGELEITLSVEVKTRVPFATRIKWLWMDGRWRHALTAVRMGLPPVRLRMVSGLSSTYEVLRGRPGRAETVAGPFRAYEEAKQAAVSEIAKMMDRVQEGERIEDSSDIFPADHP
jgi:hypothetical protein